MFLNTVVHLDLIKKAFAVQSFSLFAVTVWNPTLGIQISDLTALKPKTIDITDRKCHSWDGQRLHKGGKQKLIFRPFRLSVLCLDVNTQSNLDGTNQPVKMAFFFLYRWRKRWTYWCQIEPSFQNYWPDTPNIWNLPGEWVNTFCLLNAYNHETEFCLIFDQ